MKFLSVRGRIARPLAVPGQHAGRHSSPGTSRPLKNYTEWAEIQTRPRRAGDLKRKADFVERHQACCTANNGPLIPSSYCDAAKGAQFPPTDPAIPSNLFDADATNGRVDVTTRNETA